MLAANTQVADCQQVVLPQLALDVETPLVGQRLYVVGRKYVDIRRTIQSRRRRQYVGVRREITEQRISLHLDAVLRKSSSRQNRRRATIVNPISTAYHGFAVVIQAVSKAETRGDVVLVM